MSAINYESCKVSVFRQVLDGCGTYFDWYRLASESERLATGKLIVVEERIPEDVLWARLGED